MLVICVRSVNIHYGIYSIHEILTLTLDDFLCMDIHKKWPVSFEAQNAPTLKPYASGTDRRFWPNFRRYLVYCLIWIAVITELQKKPVTFLGRRKYYEKNGPKNIFGLDF